MRGILVALIVGLAGSAAAGRQAAPRSIEVRVVDVAGGVAYVEPGEAAGLAVGGTVVLGGAERKVIAVAGKSAAVELGAAAVAVGDRGTARIGARAVARAVGRMPSPRPLAEFRGQWRAARLPASAQAPRPVPLGRSGAAGALRGALFARGELVAPKDRASFATGWLGARVTLEPLDRPAGLDAEGALLLWAGDGLAGPDAVHRLGRVRELRLRWGSAGDPRVALGRLRWASMLAGPLDGVRVSAPLAGASLAAWGGLIPDEVSGRPDLDASSFGVEAAWDRPDRPLRPRAVVSALGTTFDGALDERKLAAEVGVEGERAAAGGHLELASFPGADPWNAPAVELQAAGADVDVRFGGAHAALALGARRQERSRRLAALLPAEWLSESPLVGAATAAAGWRRGRFDLDGGVSAYRAESADLGLEVSGFVAAAVRDIAGRGRFQLDGDAGRIDVVDWVGGGGGLGIDVLRDRLDLSARYHLTVLRFPASIEDAREHRAGARAHLRLGSTELTGDAEVVRGGGADAVLGLLSAIWRLP
ncbi:MAG TPA: hypothetical protein VFU21_00675 [Kofleriaceae bacterium]|nr:hypothetical protein [Kofleriaceae bacterium]